MDTLTRIRLESIIEGTRQFPLIDGVIYADLFTGDVDSITIEGFEITGLRFNGMQGMEYNNEILVKEKHCKDETLVDVEATWGNVEFETDAQDLIDYIASGATGEVGVRNKKIEDFSVTVASGAESVIDFWSYVNLNWGFLIRRPLIIDVAPERTRDDYLAF